MSEVVYECTTHHVVILSSLALTRTQTIKIYLCSNGALHIHTQRSLISLMAHRYSKVRWCSGFRKLLWYYRYVFLMVAMCDLGGFV